MHGGYITVPMLWLALNLERILVDFLTFKYVQCAYTVRYIEIYSISNFPLRPFLTLVTVQESEAL